MTNDPTPVVPAPGGIRINPLSGASARPSRGLAGPLSAEISAALSASAGGEVSVRSADLSLPLLEKNDILAERNRGYFLGRGLVALNLVVDIAYTWLDRRIRLE